MARFSERIGAKQPKTVLQLDSMDDDLRNGLWNVCYDLIFKDFLENYFRSRENETLRQLWRNYFKVPVDDMPYGGRDINKQLKTYFFNSSWHDVYDFVDFLARIRAHYRFAESCNHILERERSGYRFIHSQLTPITNEQEVQSLRDSLALPKGLQNVGDHLEKAIAHFSDRKSPDYPNSMKESISAVESMCKIITGDDKATLGQALKKLEEKGIPLHLALRDSFSKLYGYTNDAQGIRHGLGLTEEPDLDFDDAKFMLVSCSAFVNYLAAKAVKAGVAVGGK